MKKTSKRETLNLILSAFLILGYIVCSYFFLTMAATAPGLEPYIKVLVFAVFGLVVFYATRIGDGVQVKRFSLWTLIILDIPALYTIIASFVPTLPLHTFISNLGGTTPLSYSPILILACVALGYGIPYTFLSGYEMKEEGEIEVCDCGCCGLEEALQEFESEGELVYFTVCASDEEGALLVVDDLDPELDETKEIRQQYALTADGVAPVGSFVKLAEAECQCGCCCGCEEEVAEEKTAEAEE